ncbi:NUDIX domain-containing protein [Candidatus Leptofilum sp.]|uniref:NUDIX domain-containing protein n=1 Tax=Candidatus Leptofilum sp. TaxID=3241576 RepID=UPI003B59D5FC
MPKEKLFHRPGAYGIVRREDAVLLMTTVGLNGRYCLPGGGIEPYETNAEALQRELMEETGIQVEVGSLLHFQEDFFYYDPKDEAMHGLLFYYNCRPLTFDLLASDEVDDESVTNPQWVKIDTLHEDNLQPQEQ